ncbi:MAG TPA: plastocyanin/azurin family copper-binding protein [Candidatus Thermoplasmatota archaeon]|nr:plastocyanin/azurin family copper-binding protein [Candidatus Thermoplasmatota archaeon]
MPTRSAALAAIALFIPLALAGCLSDEPEEVEAAGSDTDGTAGTGGASGSTGGGKATAKPGNATAKAGNSTAKAAATIVEKVELAASAGGIWPINPTESVDKDSIPSGAEIHVVFKNGDTNPLGKHNWVLEGVPGAETELADAGMSAEATFIAPAPGEYAFYCSVGEHRSQGMEGKLTVT